MTGHQSKSYFLVCYDYRAKIKCNISLWVQVLDRCPDNRPELIIHKISPIILFEYS